MATTTRRLCTLCVNCIFIKITIILCMLLLHRLLGEEFMLANASQSVHGQLAPSSIMVSMYCEVYNTVLEAQRSSSSLAPVIFSARLFSFCATFWKFVFAESTLWSLNRIKNSW